MSGAGKTTACGIFQNEGFCVIDCDIVARRVVDCGKPALAEIDRSFPEGVITPEGALDRRKLGSIVFSDREKLALLDRIIYPYITFYITAAIRELARIGGNMIMLDAPTLFESGADVLCDVIVSVTADRESCAERIMKRDGITREQAEQRLGSQHDARFFRSRSDHCIENNGDTAGFEEQLKKTAAAVKESFLEKK
ncbi:MAG TPA: dephospho-CoA kinase [Ruminococcaceae bacterium]|nr:dephospho-CoA kinase [Oscillospiraceae bacterium]